MDKNEDVKNRIIKVTTELIEKYNGNTKSITARMIAEKADIGLRLINYHFGSKETLINECVQCIIGKVVTEFQMTGNYETDKERLTVCATYVFDFLLSFRNLPYFYFRRFTKLYRELQFCSYTTRIFTFLRK